MLICMLGQKRSSLKTGKHYEIILQKAQICSGLIPNQPVTIQVFSHPINILRVFTVIDGVKKYFCFMSVYSVCQLAF